jgi:uncharacterized membrane protein
MPARSRRARRGRQVFTVSAVALAAWLALHTMTGTAAFFAGFVSGFLAAALAVVLILAAAPHAERLSRLLGARTRAAVNRPVPRRPRPPSTPIHDLAARRQNGE